ncbi:MAG: pyridoxal phosphate-dependent aminotransferase [Deltaproteobacteria bacterium]|nr:pyridoxal phosphate-dependent aminotransferase [Deltaproteobacteria bacterium]
MRVVERVERIKPFYVMEFLEIAKAKEKEGIDIIHMEVGEPDFDVSKEIKEKAHEGIEKNIFHYTHSLGMVELREAISEYYRNVEGLYVSPERIIITSGTSGAFLLLFLCLLDQTKTLVFSDPGYPCYRNLAILCGSKILPIPVDEKTNYMITPESLEAFGAKPDVLVLASPSNPTGTVYTEEIIREVYEYLKEGGGILIVDEIYKDLIYDCEIKTALSISDEIIVVNGFSKTHAMTGFRVGWMVVPSHLVKPIQKCSQNVFICPPSISQYAALCAFSSKEQLLAVKKEFKRRRDFLVKELLSLGFSIPYLPQGAFYIYAGIEKWKMDSMDFCRRALSEAHVAITPGYDFGDYQAQTHVRFSYAQKMDKIEEGTKRLKAWLKTIT